MEIFQMTSHQKFVFSSHSGPVRTYSWLLVVVLARKFRPHPPQVSPCFHRFAPEWMLLEPNLGKIYLFLFHNVVAGNDIFNNIVIKKNSIYCQNMSPFLPKQAQGRKRTTCIKKRIFVSVLCLSILKKSICRVFAVGKGY